MPSRAEKIAAHGAILLLVVLVTSAARAGITPSYWSIQATNPEPVLSPGHLLTKESGGRPESLLAPPSISAVGPIRWPETPGRLLLSDQAGISQLGETTRGAVGSQNAPVRPPKPFKYTVESGDTVLALAERFGISVETILWANDIVDPDSLQVGDELVILPVSGVLHKVASGDNLNDLALLYDVEPEAIAKENALSDPGYLQVGQELVVPGGKLQMARANPSSRGGRSSAVASGSFRWPAGGSITQYFGEAGHSGLDLANPMGSPVYAADGGVVVTVLKLDYGYGWHVIVDHGNGYQTLYAHLSGFNVDYGERVAKGDTIGWVGSTGLSTGPHLHFEVLRGGVRIDPLGVLP